MDPWKSIGGMYRAELTSAEPEASVHGLNLAGIEVYQLIYRSALVRQFSLCRKDYPKAAALLEKRGDQLKIIKRLGCYWHLRSLMRRPVLLAGAAALLLAAMYLPTRVLFVRVEGNVTVPERQILAAAEASGISFGASRRAVRSEKTKNTLLQAVPQLQWAGVNTAGCVATISVRERAPDAQAPVSQGIGHIVAERDGYIVSATATRGTPLVTPGQTVEKGQMLISGYADYGFCLQATMAEGEVYAQTHRDFSIKTPEQYLALGENQGQKHCWSLLLGKKRINLWKDSGICQGSCGRIYEENYLTLPGGFQLPVALCKETYIFRQATPVRRTPEQAQKDLLAAAEGFLLDAMVAGRILDRAYYVSRQAGAYSLEADYVCLEMIGRVQQEQIGDTNGKTG